VGVWRSALELFKAAEDLATDSAVAGIRGSGRSSQRGVISAWQSGSLAHVPWSDVYGTTLAPVTIAEAMRVGPLKRGRAILRSLLLPRPLVAIDNTGAKLTQQPRWLYRTDTPISPQQRLGLMLDDHLWFDATLLVVLRGATPANGGFTPILDAVHCPRERWELDEDGVILVEGQPAPADAVVWIPGPSAGLLAEAADEIRQWRTMGANISRRLASPTPSMILEDDEDNLADDEIDALVRSTNEARRSPDGATMYLPRGIRGTPVQANDDSQLYVAGRNAARLDLANHLNLPASLLEGSQSTASLTYSTKEGARDELADYSLDYWTTPLTSALSLDNVTPRGTRIRFDLSDLYATTNAPLGANVED
jgi:hypothetical protein